MTEKRFTVEVNDHHYDVIIGDGIMKQLEQYLRESGVTIHTKCLIITDDHVAPLYLEQVKKSLANFQVYTYVVSPGETAKSLGVVEKIITFMIENGFDRSSYIIAFGGGVVGDLSGFIASIYMRGIPFIQCPTTILAHDSSVGGKVGINHTLGKNLIGAFHQPSLVIYDTQLLLSLPEREVRSGLAEVIKHGFIADPEFINWLEQNAELLLQLKLEALNKALFHASQIKAMIVKEDERENGIRAYLNFGHTLAHSIETLSNYQYSHGEAVAIGMVFATRLAEKMGFISAEVGDLYQKMIEQLHLPIRIPNELSTDEVLKVMMRDKKFKQNQVRMVLPVAIGEVKIVEGIQTELIRCVIEVLKE
ncbi:3-dehydroquinate synthase [Tepidibacillus marianensis]|uniref:3-dehydroquinate synthase n=1 Tax=Tepidibacillus marianensis TaxID=3131995 RepID=UPI0030CE5FB4